MLINWSKLQGSDDVCKRIPVKFDCWEDNSYVMNKTPQNTFAGATELLFGSYITSLQSSFFVSSIRISPNVDALHHGCVRSQDSHLFLL